MKRFLFITAACLLASKAGFCELALMPQPAHVTLGSAGAGVVIGVDFTTAVTGPGATDVRIVRGVPRFLDRLTKQTGVFFAKRTPIRNSAIATLVVVVEQKDHPAPQRLGDNETYSLTVTSGAAKLSATRPLGALRGLETFLQLVQPSRYGFAAPQLEIQDQPRFGWRGLSLDVSRHFIPLSEVERTIDGMSAVKLNVFHWHLSDDQGFRVESKLFPRLQEYGSEGLYYTQRQIREVIAYARDRGVRVVPEFDMPGHATAMLAAYPRLGSGPGPYSVIHQFGISGGLIDPAKEYTYWFLNKFIGEMARLFPDKFFHIGGDEVNPREWNENPEIQAFMRKHNIADAHALQAYFNRRLQKIVSRYGKRMEGWDEILQPTLPKTIVIESWRGQQSLADAARERYEGILAAGYYLDLMQPASMHYAVDPLKGATAQLTETEKKRILGGEAAMWEELATAQNLDQKLWPRLAAIAERLWSPEDVTDIESMYRRLMITSRWLEWDGLQHLEMPRKMQDRLAGEMQPEPLRIFASVLEPLKEYARADKVGGYTTFTPLNRLVDSIPPESIEAREFRDAVDRFTANTSRDQADAEYIAKKLRFWSENIPAVLPVLESNELLRETLPVAGSERILCDAGLAALDEIRTKDPHRMDSLKAMMPAVDQAAKSTQAEVLIEIAPGVQKLVSAATAQTTAMKLQ